MALIANAKGAYFGHLFQFSQAGSSTAPFPILLQNCHGRPLLALFGELFA